MASNNNDNNINNNDHHYAVIDVDSQVGKDFPGKKFWKIQQEDNDVRTVIILCNMLYDEPKQKGPFYFAGKQHINCRGIPVVAWHHDQWMDVYHGERRKKKNNWSNFIYKHLLNPIRYDKTHHLTRTLEAMSLDQKLRALQKAEKALKERWPGTVQAFGLPVVLHGVPTEDVSTEGTTNPHGAQPNSASQKRPTLQPQDTTESSPIKRQRLPGVPAEGTTTEGTANPHGARPNTASQKRSPSQSEDIADELSPIKRQRLEYGQGFASSWGAPSSGFGPGFVASPHNTTGIQAVAHHPSAVAGHPTSFEGRQYNAGFYPMMGAHNSHAFGFGSSNANGQQQPPSTPLALFNTGGVSVGVGTPLNQVSPAMTTMSHLTQQQGQLISSPPVDYPVMTSSSGGVNANSWNYPAAITSSYSDRSSSRYYRDEDTKEESKSAAGQRIWMPVLLAFGLGVALTVLVLTSTSFLATAINSVGGKAWDHGNEGEI